MSVKIQDAKKSDKDPKLAARLYSRFRQTPLLAAESLGANSPVYGVNPVRAETDEN
jgi:hypothetical protein